VRSTRPPVGELSTLPADAVLAARLEGARGVLRELKARSLWRVGRYDRMLVVEQDLDSFRESPLPPGVEIRPLLRSEQPFLSTLASSWKRERFRLAAERGRTCLVAWRGGRAVGYTWISASIDPDIELYPIQLPPGAAYGWDLFVLRSERGRGVGSALVSARLGWARERGFRTMRRAVAPGNRAALRTLQKTAGGGTRILGELVWVRFLGRSFTRYRALRRADRADARVGEGASI
jgi:GNAT superfamily N-acetyltransferase